MEKIGRIKYTSNGEYSPDATYTPMNTVLFEGSRWECIKEATGNAPPDHVKNEDGSIAENEFWRLFLPGALGDDYIKKTDIAKAPTETEAGKPGIVIPDGKTIQIDENGLLTGTPIDFKGTPKELQEAIQAGEITDGMNLFIDNAEDSGEPDPDHPNNMLFPLDDFLSTVSTNAVQNWVLTNALNRLEQLENETRSLRAGLETFGLSKIAPTDLTDVTVDNGIVLGAKEKNASVSGTLANMLEILKNELEISIWIDSIPDGNNTINHTVEKRGTYLLYATGLKRSDQSYLNISVNGGHVASSHANFVGSMQMYCTRVIKCNAGDVISFESIGLEDRSDSFQFAEVVRIGKY